MSVVRQYNKVIANISKLHQNIEEQSFGDEFSHISTTETNTNIHLTTELTNSNYTVLDDLVNNFIDYTTAESLESYLEDSVFPFIKKLINKFASENIAMGITQAGKTGHLLGLFERKYDVHLNTFPISLKATFDTGSLYESLNILNFLINMPTEYSDLSPYVTPERLQDMADEITEFLT